MNGHCVILIFLDLLAVFDSVAHFSMKCLIPLASRTPDSYDFLLTLQVAASQILLIPPHSITSFGLMYFKVNSWGAWVLVLSRYQINK